MISFLSDIGKDRKDAHEVLEVGLVGLFELVDVDASDEEDGDADVEAGVSIGRFDEPR